MKKSMKSELSREIIEAQHHQEIARALGESRDEQRLKWIKGESNKLPAPLRDCRDTRNADKYPHIRLKEIGIIEVLGGLEVEPKIDTFVIQCHAKNCKHEAMPDRPYCEKHQEKREKETAEFLNSLKKT